MINKLKNISSKHTFWILFTVFLLGLGLKLINYWDMQIFAYDQARDAQRVLEILGGHIKIVGPETDIKGVFNGPLYYYLLAPIYLISNFDPNIVGLFMILLNLSGIFIIYYLCKVLFKNKYVGLISALFWAISYEQANFARFISNASFMPICTLLFFLGLAMYFVRQNKWGIYISFFGLGTAIHFNVYLAYLIVLYPLLYIVFRPKLYLRDTVLGLLGFIFLLSPFALAELKWNFMASRSLLAYFSSHTKEGNSFLANLNSYPARISGALYYGFFSFDKIISFLLLFSALGLVYRNLRDRKALVFLLIWLFSTFPLFFFKSGVITAEVINTSIFGALTIVFGLAVFYLLKSRFWLLGIAFFALILISNLSLFVNDGFKDYRLFALQTLVLKEEKQIIDYTYDSSPDKEFSVCAVTNPLFVNTLWSYLYKYYGERKYGYIPNWSGQKQNLNASLMPYDIGHIDTRYFIVEPLGGIPDFAPRTSIYMEDQISVIREKKNFGSLIVQRRSLDLNKAHLRDSQGLSPDLLSQTQNLVSQDPRYSCYNNY